MSPCPVPTTARTFFASVTPRYSWTTSRPAPTWADWTLRRRLVSRLGTVESPGSTLVSVTGAVERPTVLEVALVPRYGSSSSPRTLTPTPRRCCSGATADPGSPLRTWISTTATRTSLARARRPARGHRGAAARRVRIVETLRVVRWMANESARQCGPCAFGLPAIAEDLNHLAHPSRDPMSATSDSRNVSARSTATARAATRRCGPLRTLGLATFAQDFSAHAHASAVQVRGPTCTTRACPTRTRGGTRMGVRRRAGLFVLQVNPILCDGFGHCGELAPELVKMDEWATRSSRPSPRPSLTPGPTNRPATPNEVPSTALRIHRLTDK